MKAVIRLSNESDVLQMLAIYAPIVRDTLLSFEVEPPSEREFRQRVKEYQEKMPWLVCESDGKLLGYAYAIPYHPSRPAYQWSVRSSVYVSVEHRKKGVGKALYTSLFKLLQLQGFYNVYAAISLPNPESVALHEAVSFSPIGVLLSAGYKLGQWHDVGWWQLSLQQERSHIVNPPLYVREIQRSPLWDEALKNGILQLRF